jgi:serine/threonine protein kinase
MPGGENPRRKEDAPEIQREISAVVFDPRTGKRYRRGKFLGKGGFARCYELIDRNGTIYAGKAVPKALLTKQHHKDKMVQEIVIHRKLNHKHIVGFHTNFEDSNFVYVLLELCRKRSLMELHRRRRAVTEPEARYFTAQIVDACVYLHGNRVIHRDLKLGNLFLNDELEVKVGDFGLATVMEANEERKQTLCGTPNYIAPEMLRKAGHSFGVDVWAIGCILYTLLVGKPPFESESLKETYVRIKNNEYHLPSRLSTAARCIIRDMLAPKPEMRPTVNDLLKYDFFTHGYLPERLPTSCLTTAPKFSDQFALSVGGTRIGASSTGGPALGQTRANIVAGAGTTGALVGVSGSKYSENMHQCKKEAAAPAGLGNIPEDIEVITIDDAAGIGVAPPGFVGKTNEENQFTSGPAVVGAAKDSDENNDDLTTTPKDCFLRVLYQQLLEVVNSNPSQRQVIQMEEAEDPAYSPVFWVSKWVDYSDKYGLGYQLCDDSVGVLFNDVTKLVLNKDGKQAQYISNTGTEEFFLLDDFPKALQKKTTLLKYFRDYMTQHLLAAGAEAAQKTASMLVPRLPYLRTWFRTRSAIVLQLSNGTLQVNFFKDHTKVILCPLMQAVTYINEEKDFRCYPFKAILESGCSTSLAQRLNYAQNMCERLITFQSVVGNTLPASIMGGSGRSGSGRSAAGGVEAASRGVEPMVT